MSDVPKVIHRYTVVERLGRGGMGEVFLAHDPTLDRDVAVKVLSAATSRPTSCASASRAKPGRRRG